MTSPVWTSLIAVGGTLAGVLVTWWGQSRQARQTLRRSEMVSAVTALAVALANHRRMTWVLVGHRLSGADARTLADAEAATHDTWAAVTAPLVSVKVLAPKFTNAAEAVTEAIYAMLGSADMETLNIRRDAARVALDQLLSSASAYFTGEALSASGRVAAVAS